MNGPGLTPLRTLITTLITKLPFLVTQNSSSSTSMRPNHELSENFVLETRFQKPCQPSIQRWLVLYPVTVFAIQTAASLVKTPPLQDWPTAKLAFNWNM